MIKFEWDDNKNKINILKHNVDFKEALTVFFDDNALLIEDDAHSSSEERFILLGLSSRTNVLIVCHCYRANEEVIRIISARKATKNETKQYLEGRGL